MADARPAATEVEVTAADLPLHCPPPSAPAWNSHPRVRLVVHEGLASCPYCGTRYRVRGAAAAAGH